MDLEGLVRGPRRGVGGAAGRRPARAPRRLAAQLVAAGLVQAGVVPGGTAVLLPGLLVVLAAVVVLDDVRRSRAGRRAGTINVLPATDARGDVAGELLDRVWALTTPPAGHDLARPVLAPAADGSPRIGMRLTDRISGEAADRREVADDFRHLRARLCPGVVEVHAGRPAPAVSGGGRG